MLTAIVLILVLIAVLAVAAWWFFEFDAPEVVIPVAAPGLGTGVLYWWRAAGLGDRDPVGGDRGLLHLPFLFDAATRGEIRRIKTGGSSRPARCKSCPFALIRVVSGAGQDQFG